MSRFLSARNSSWLSKVRQAISIGFFLAIRDVKRANIWTTLLIVTVMVLTFLNLIVVSGILVGLIQSSVDANKKHYTSDIIISTPLKKDYIERSSEIISVLESHPAVDKISARYLQSATIEANYKNRVDFNDKVDMAGALVSGIDPAKEDALTGISKFMMEGRFLLPSDTDAVVIGADLLAKYTQIESPGFQTLKNVEAGSRVRLNIGDISREVTVVGVIKAKVGDVDQRFTMVDREVRTMIGRTDYNVDEIAVKLKPGATADSVKAALVNLGFDQVAKIQSSDEALPKFLKDITATFALLGNLIGSIGLAVACITIFIIIFVNAITRRRFIGILKGIGIQSSAIEMSYIFQSIFYAVAGIVLGTLLVFVVLKPYLDANPINFPFSDGTLVATYMGTLIRGVVLLGATMIAGYIPARLVVKQNTLDAILGR
jgi:ABC-type lipoprotein release transport system permease subunit